MGSRWIWFRGVVPLSSLVGCAGPTPLDTVGAETSTSTAQDEPSPVGDDGPEEPEPVDPRPTIEVEPPPPPVYGGTLLVLADGTTAVVSDPDRGLVHVVDRSLAAGPATIDVGTASEPWRAAQTSDGRVHIVARGSGEVLTIDTEAAALVSRRPVCRHPRGIAASGERVVVACANGELWSADADAAPLDRLDADLRDAFFDPQGVLFVTRFRSAQVLELATEGGIAERWLPTMRVDEHDEPWKPSTAWRTIATDGGWLMVHQLAADRLIERNANVPFGRSTWCGAAVQSAITMRGADGVVRSSGRIADVALPVDIAIDATGERLAIAVAAGCGPECVTAQLAIVETSVLTEDLEVACVTPELIRLADDPAQMIAVAFAPDGTLLVQQREPAVIHALPPKGDARQLALGGASVEDTGHRLFHETAEAPVACASCHPERGDDGQVWWVDERRHTPALHVGLGGTAPFHWSGDLESFASLIEETHGHRMGALPLDDAQLASFERWTMHGTLAPSRAPDEQTEIGRVAWVEHGCENCHGAARTGVSAQLSGDTELLQVPPLRGVATHPPWMHDGRASSLGDAVREMIVRTVPGATPTPDEIAAIAAYLETL